MTAWSPTFISPTGVDRPDRVVRLRGTFALATGHGPVRRARLRESALGVIESRLNGRAVSDALLTPGHSAYEWRLRFAEHDVCDRLQPHNTLELWLAPGWYAGRLGWEGSRALYGVRTAAAAELTIELADGFTQTVSTDASWSWAPSPVVAADLYDGQTRDAREPDPGPWGAVEVIAAPSARLEPYTAPPVVRHEALAPRSVSRSPQGKLLVDFGQNLVGWTRLRVTGQAGAEVTIRHAEVLENGELGTRPLRSAQATDRIILSGGTDVFEPTFTFHGFRYAEITGWPGSDDELLRAVEAVVVGSRLERTGWFRSSDDLLNRFHENVVWSMRGNFLDVPTDCPQRDERLGWTGDIAVFAPTATFLFDVQDFLTDWMDDLHEETRHAQGVVPHVVPNVLKHEPKAAGNTSFGSPLPTAIWGDAAVWVPWALYQRDGDRSRLERMYPAMLAHAAAVEQALSPDGVWEAGFQFGDWLDPSAPPDDPAAAATPTALVATAAGHRSFVMLQRAAQALGRTQDAGRHESVARRLREGFRARWWQDGRLSVESVTGYALAIEFGLLDDDEIVTAGERLVHHVREVGHRITTGFAGTPYVTDALTRSGHLEDAYRLLLQTACPSWLYPVTMGATTVWERWDSMLPDGSINPGQMTSFNHYALGSVADWLHRSVGGLAAVEPGFGRVLVAPRPGPGLDWCETALDTDRGQIRVRWELTGDDLRVQVRSPVPGVLRLPGLADQEFGPGVPEFLIPWDRERHTTRPAEVRGDERPPLKRV